ncbi:MAG: DUF2306 domain-containing protein [Chiayiivirga sp.]|jgi:hypothetical protein|uniref:DUF2306 domain-containing protein n=1 Tax=Chiayiivirga sp. TaxID=2041042 RepID=UPI0025BA55C5|nr:DUF2306 domain-containing protein [Chiayiivirga sp.]MCI1730601.1 DUF2306 domain-containing protein [Chiayiivirga sp.]
MNSVVAASRPAASVRARFHAPLDLAARAWFLAALVGQWLFVWYIVAAYAAPLVAGQPAEVNRTGPITGYVAGDGLGNTMLFSHVLAGAVLSAGGLLQLLPWLRRRMPGWHRWNGRVFLVLALAGTLSGLFLTWVRGSRLSDITALGISLNGVLIIVAAAMAWRYAVQRRYDAHRRWAIRAFLLVNGVWTMRLGFMAWVIINQGPRGNTAQLDGPFDVFWAFGCYLLPLAVAELYFRAARGGKGLRLAATIVLTVGTGLTLLGVFGAWRVMWGPYV